MKRDLSSYMNILKKEKEFLLNKYNVDEIGIFGSYSRGEEKAESDIDILVDFTSPIGWDVVDLKDYLEKKLRLKVDLILKGGISRNTRLWNEMKEEIIYA